MTIEAEVAALTTATTALLSTVNVKKDTLDGYIADTAADAASAASSAITAASEADASAVSATAAADSATSASGSATAAAASALAAVALANFDPATKANVNNPTFTGTVNGISKGMVGLGNVDNTADSEKPVSTAQATAIDAKESPSNKDISGGYAGLTLFKLNLKNTAGTVTNYFTSSSTVSRTWTLPNRSGTLADNTDLALKASVANPTFTGTVGGISKGMVGLGSVDNTADTDKPVSTAQATAIEAKANKGANSDITSLSGLTTALSIEQGGTGATTPAYARTALGISGQAFSAERSSTLQTISSGTLTKVQCNSEEYDYGGVYDPTTNFRFQPTIADVYTISAGVAFAGTTGAVSFLAAYVYKNGSSKRLLGEHNSNAKAISGTVQIYLNGTTDYLESYTYVVATTPQINMSAGTFFQAHRTFSV